MQLFSLTELSVARKKAVGNDMANEILDEIVTRNLVEDDEVELDDPFEDIDDDDFEEEDEEWDDDDLIH